jgi:hypothetical protein
MAKKQQGHDKWKIHTTIGTSAVTNLISSTAFNSISRNIQQHQQEHSTASAGEAVNQSSAVSAIDCIQNTLQINMAQNSKGMTSGKFIRRYIKSSAFELSWFREA